MTDETSSAESAAGDAAPGVDPKLLEILVCPVTKTGLRYDAHARELISEAAGLAFPIRDGVPIMLVDEARRLDDTPVPQVDRARVGRHGGLSPDAGNDADDDADDHAGPAGAQPT